MTVRLTKPLEVKAEPGDVIISAPTGRILLNIEGKLYVLAEVKAENVSVIGE